MQAPATIRIPPAPGPPKMCKNCNVKAAHAGYSYCGKTCAKAAKKGSTAPAAGAAPAANANAPQSGAMCANCKVRPVHGSHHHCGKTCASIAARQRQPYSPPVIGRAQTYQPPQSPPYNTPYGPPSGYPGYPPHGYGYSPAGPSYPYSPVPPVYPAPRGYNSPRRGGPRPPPQRRNPRTSNRGPRKPPAAAVDWSSEDEYSTESEDHHRRPNNRPPRRREEDDDSFSESDSGYPSSEEERENSRRRDNRRGPSGRTETRSPQTRAATSPRNDPLCIVCRRHPKYTGHQFCSKQCRDSLSLSQDPEISGYSRTMAAGDDELPGSSMSGAMRSDVPPAYSDIEDE